MITTEVARVGDSVTFKTWAYPYDVLRGTVVEVQPDVVKAAKYIIRPEKNMPK